MLAIENSSSSEPRPHPDPGLRRSAICRDHGRREEDGGVQETPLSVVPSLVPPQSSVLSSHHPHLSTSSKGRMVTLESLLLSDTSRASRRAAPHPLIFRLISWAIDTIVTISSIVRIPLLSVAYVFNPTPFPGWSFNRLVQIRTERFRGTLLSWVLPTILFDERRKENWDLYTEEEKEGRVKIDVLEIPPVDARWTGGFASLGEVKAETRPAFLICPLSGGRAGKDRADGSRIILHLHGGGYIRGHPLWTPFPYNIARATGLDCLSVCYRKTLSPSSSFPAPLFDALSAYSHLTQTLHYAPSSILLLGESAGGHLSLLLSQYLHQLGLPQPGCIALSSPWSDWSPSYPSYAENEPYDSVCMPRLRGAVLSATRYFEREALKSPWFSPSKASPGHWTYLQQEGVGVYLQYGGREAMRDEVAVLGERMKRDGVRVRVREDVNGVHTSALTDGGARKMFEKDLVEMLSDGNGAEDRA
ncbi:hypothetical protein B9479_005671 [Cryptococcus floricola]|uniref:Alpha/beta hydrolase fold-3 domain-containing protein n=1 Tax=Cryptococcus floricola TaxID=2591691 RepID=A0A5D3ASM2_9TREE|nr:hypothetical protein B9479_005671 [Cryptococcus floricola]